MSSQLVRGFGRGLWFSTTCVFHRYITLLSIHLILFFLSSPSHWNVFLGKSPNSEVKMTHFCLKLTHLSDLFWLFTTHVRWLVSSSFLNMFVFLRYEHLMLWIHPKLSFNVQLSLMWHALKLRDKKQQAYLGSRDSTECRARAIITTKKFLFNRKQFCRPIVCINQ